MKFHVILKVAANAIVCFINTVKCVEMVDFYATILDCVNLSARIIATYMPSKVLDTILIVNPTRLGSDGW